MRRLNTIQVRYVIRCAVLAAATSVALAPPARAAWNASVPGGAAAQSAQAIALPANLVVPEPLRPLLREMWERSPTFRAQCARIRRAAWLAVTLRLGSATQAGQGGARTRFTKSNGLTHAEVILSVEMTLNSQSMLIAHELEHVIEQLDGVQLTGRAQSGVSRDASGRFETARAAYVGEQVSQEVGRSLHANRAGAPE